MVSSVLASGQKSGIGNFTKEMDTVSSEAAISQLQRHRKKCVDVKMLQILSLNICVNRGVDNFTSRLIPSTDYMSSEKHDVHSCQILALLNLCEKFGAKNQYHSNCRFDDDGVHLMDELG